MLKLDQIELVENNTRFNYRYTTKSGAAKYFKTTNLFYAKYDRDISSVPESLAVIPFLSNVITIAWFAGFNIYVNEVDEDFYKSIQELRNVFQKWYPNKKLNGELKAKNLVKNTLDKNNTAMLFSGGVDAFATYIRNFEQKPDLITIHGPDIAIEDTKQWFDLKEFIHNEELLSQNSKHTIESNVRDFYTYKVNLLIENLGWWGKVQHGIALLGLTAPLSWVKGYEYISIASSYTKDVDISWGSTPETDEILSWAGLQVHHDGYELRRQDKVDLIADFSERTGNNFKLRVCYSERRDGFNCSKCEKCYRTILGLVLAGQDPNNFGFNVDGGFYEKMFLTIGEGSSSKGMNYFWWELKEKAQDTKDPFIFDDLDTEIKFIKSIAEGQISNKLKTKLVASNQKRERLKFILRNKLAPLYETYLKLRYNR
ncbi:hypothetical protein [Spongiivirga citrea]|uniref:hypothetical protein n=1 Tax=Spongiivirga citrea TaxID=1481457 RepID=UPI001EF803F2|nr:hypothetical protein [Spongiivirga citrea]